MSKTNPYDTVLDGVNKRIEQVSDKLADRFKGIKPFNKEKIPRRELLQYYNGLDVRDMEYLIQRHGYDTVNSFIGEMEAMKAKEQENV